MGACFSVDANSRGVLSEVRRIQGGDTQDFVRGQIAVRVVNFLADTVETIHTLPPAMRPDAPAGVYPPPEMFTRSADRADAITIVTGRMMVAANEYGEPFYVTFSNDRKKTAAMIVADKIVTDALSRGQTRAVAVTSSDLAVIQNWCDALTNTENYRLDGYIPH